MNSVKYTFIYGCLLSLTDYECGNNIHRHFCQKCKISIQSYNNFQKTKFVRQAKQKLKKIPLFEEEFSTMLENKGHHCGSEKEMVEYQMRLGG